MSENFNIWLHIVATWNLENKIANIYINGNLEGIFITLIKKINSF